MISPPAKSLGLSFGKKLTLMILGIVLMAVLIVAGVIFSQYYRSHTQMIINQLDGQGQRYAQSFTDWLEARQQEMLYLASLDPLANADEAAVNHLLTQIADAQGVYDTLFLVSPEGRGLAGVAFESGRARAMPFSEAQAFNVPDRSWFQQAISGKDVFSQPVISRATGNQVSTVASPVYQGDRIVGVMRGAVTLSTLIERIRALNDDPNTDIFLISSDGMALTPTRSVSNPEQAITSDAAKAIAAMESGSGRYDNAAGVPVVGSYIPIPLLGWGLVLEQTEKNAMAPVYRTIWTLLLILAAILILALLTGMAIVRSVTRTLGGDPAYAAAVVGDVADGDLTREVEVSKGAGASLLGSIEQMRVKLRGTIERIKVNSETLASAATELSQISQQTDSGVRQQSTQLENAATAINEMSATVEEVARNAQMAADHTIEASNRAEAGSQVVASAASSMQALSKDISDAAEVIRELKNDSDLIGQVLQVIRDVANQTNLLALNASIEAARAGDSGRGFAVVADEVRNLARRTEESTNEIQQVIDQLQGRSESAVKAISQSVEKTHATLELADHANTALNDILNVVSSAHDMIQHIATATEEQSAVAKEINQNIHLIKDVADQSATHVGESTEATNSLSMLAEQLREEMNRFRV
ncbi:methyl-accepting chemotaxis protein [Nitrincola sp.]|uniref:methyl-accepting chemotaxis protein n=1 Tax=Nitrincola sp. TaxID=1926584 RepID=UPI003A914FF0